MLGDPPGWHTVSAGPAGACGGPDPARGQGGFPRGGGSRTASQAHEGSRHPAGPQHLLRDLTTLPSPSKSCLV